MSNILGNIVGVPTIEDVVTYGVSASMAGYQPTNFAIPSGQQIVDEVTSKIKQIGFSTVTGIPAVSKASVKSGVIDSPVISSYPSSLVDSSGSRKLSSTELKVRISQEPSVGDNNVLEFTVMPRIQEQRSIDYDAVTPVHHPGAIQKYRNTAARSWSVTGRLMSRTSQEATTNLNIINMIRAWAMPFYGEGTASDQELNQYLGAPPPILTLSAYGPNMIGPIKCVLTSYSWDFDNALDYIPTLTGNPFPVILDISLSLMESWAPSEFSGFNLRAFKAGDLSSTGAFKRMVITPPAQTAPAPTRQRARMLSPAELTTVAGGGRGTVVGPTAQDLALARAEREAKAATSWNYIPATGGLGARNRGTLANQAADRVANNAGADYFKAK